MEELQSCSFCGVGEAEITWDKRRDDELYCFVECDCCGVSTSVYVTVAEAVEAWNRMVE